MPASPIVSSPFADVPAPSLAGSRRMTKGGLPRPAVPAEHEEGAGTGVAVSDRPRADEGEGRP